MRGTTRQVANLVGKMKADLSKAMRDPDRYVVELDYCDKKGNRTRRTISPIRFVNSDRVLGLCLCRQEPRQFYLSRCDNVGLRNANDVLMPVPLG